MHNRSLKLFIIIIIFTSCTKLTIVPEGADETWSFVVFSDVQQGYGILSKLSQNIARLDPAPRVAFCCGDIMLRSGNEAEWISFRQATKSMRQKMPLYIVRGNHEGNDLASEICLHRYGEISSDRFYYTRSEENAFFIILDTFESGNTGSIKGEQLNWLQHKLDSSASDPNVTNVFIFMHQPLYPQGRHKGENLVNADELHELFLKYKKIRAIFSGHDHLFNKYIKDGIIYLTTGGGGGPLYHGFGGNYHHFSKITFYSDTTHINVKTIGIFNETIDDFEL